MKNKLQVFHSELQNNLRLRVLKNSSIKYNENDLLNTKYLEIEVFTKENVFHKIIFDSAESYRVTDESFISLVEIDKDVINDNSAIYYSEQSDYLTWLKQVSHHIYDDSILNLCKHYYIVTLDEIVEVISLDEPKIIKC